MAKARNSTFYTGFTKNLVRRVWGHKNELADGFTKRYGVKTLVYYEVFDEYNTALYREKQLKRWRRTSKMKLIEKINPNWEDLYESICK